MKKTLSALAAIVAIGMLAGQTILARVGTNTTLIVTPSSPVFGSPDGEHVDGVSEDGAPGFAHGSFKSDGLLKTDMYFTVQPLFGDRPVTVGDVANISYWTKKATTHADNLVDWSVIIYTAPYAGDASTPTWYGARFGTEPYFAQNIVDPADTWNQWSSDDPVNRMRFYESTAGAPGANFGSYTDPDWAAFKAANALSGHPRSGLPVLFFSIQTGSATATGFTGQVDGLRIELTDGSVAKVNLEPFVVAADLDSCKKGGYLNLFRPNGSGFGTQGDCVSFVNTGK